MGNEVLSCYGSGDFRPARVSRAFRSRAEEGVAITLRSGRRIVSTPEHTHFAGYRVGVSPQLHMTYLMRRQGYGARVGVTRTYTNPRGDWLGYARRASQEVADSCWVVGVHPTEAEARAHEIELSLRYALPTVPFVARGGREDRGVLSSQRLIDRIFAGVDSDTGGRALLADHRLAEGAPHHLPRTFAGRRRVVTVTLCGDRRGRTPMHTVAVGGRDPGVKRALEDAGFTVRPAKSGSSSWRYESAFSSFDELMDVIFRIWCAAPVSVRCVARIGNGGAGACNTLPFLPAASVMQGMAMFDENGEYDVVESVERVKLDRPVYDLDVENTHNFVAEGLVTHNSIYAFRGADIANILDFRDDYPDAHVVKLEQNYRSTQTILSAANAVVQQQPGADDEGAVVGHRRGGSDPGPGDGGRARGGSVRRRRDRADGRRGRVARRDRGLLPDQRAVAGPGGHAGPRADRLPGHRRHEVLRAGGDPGRDRVPDLPGQPAGRQRVHARRQLAPPRDRPDVALARAQPRRHDGDPGLGRRRGARVGPRARRRRAEGAAALHVDDGAHQGARRGRGAGRRDPRRAAARDAATWKRWRPSARSRPRAGSRTSRRSSSAPASTTRCPRTARSASSSRRSR